MRTINIRVIPNARKDEINDEGGLLIVRIRAPPDKGKANRALLKILSKYYGKRVFLVAGGKSRDKVIEIED